MSVLTELKSNEADKRQALAKEAFSIILKPTATPKELNRLAELRHCLDWSDKMLATLGQAADMYRSLTSEVAKPIPSRADVDGLVKELRILEAEWEKTCHAYEKQHCELARKADWQNRQLFHRESLVRELQAIREIFAPLFGTGVKWGGLNTSGGPAQALLRMILAEEKRRGA